MQRPETTGVGILVLDTTKLDVLLGKRMNAYKAGTLGLPGGRLELHESLITCCEKELVEETDLKAKNIEYIGVVRELQEKCNFIHFGFVCNDYEGIPTVTEPNKCESWDWYSLNDLPANILPGHKAILDMYLHPEITYRDIIK